MIKVIVYDWIKGAEQGLVDIFEGTEEEVEIQLRAKFMKETKDIRFGSVYVVIKTISERFGVHLEAWKKL